MFSAWSVPVNLLDCGDAEKKSDLVPTLKNFTVRWEILTNKQFYIRDYIEAIELIIPVGFQE